MIKKIAYPTSFDQVMAYFKIQVVDSLPFAFRVVPVFDHPEDLFYWLKDRTKYRNDPKGVEFFQTLQTLFKNGGCGDCDCFTIATVACMVKNGWKDFNVVLVGRSKSYPVHIYTDIVWAGRRYVLDLTNPRFNMERFYPYRQRVPVRWWNWEK